MKDEARDETKIICGFKDCSQLDSYLEEMTGEFQNTQHLNSKTERLKRIIGKYISIWSCQKKVQNDYK